MSSRIIVLILAGIFIQSLLGAVVPKASNVPNYSQMREIDLEDDNIQLATMQEEFLSSVALLPPEQPNILPDQPTHLPVMDAQKDEDLQKPPTDPTNTPQNGQNTLSDQNNNCNSNAQNTDQAKLLNVIAGLQLVQKINDYKQLQNLEATVRNTQAAAALGISPGVSSESGFNLYGGGVTSEFLNNALITNGIVGPVVSTDNTITSLGSMGIAQTAIANLLTILSTVANNAPTTANNLIAAVSPAGIPIVTNLGTGLLGSGTGILGTGTGTGILGTGLLGTGILGTGTGTGILGTNLLAGIKPTATTGGVLGLLSGLGLGGGNLALSGGNVVISGGLPTVVGGIPVTTTGGLSPVINSNKPAVLLLLNALLSRLGFSTSINGLRSLNGRSDQTDKNEMNWMASIMVDGKIIAEGVLVSDQHVLTIATPLMNIDHKDVRVRIGQSDRCSKEVSSVDMTVTSILANPHFNPQTKSHDMALLKLSKKLEDDKALPICLPSLSSEYILKEVGIPTWKSSTPNELLCKPRHLMMPLMKEEACSSSIDPLSLLTSDKSCMSAKVGDENICHATVGTPVQHTGKDGITELLGLISNPAQCEKSNSAYFIRVQDHLPWLLDHIKEDTMCLRI